MVNHALKPVSEDRAFRPDIEGLRAVAVALVVLFHYFRTAVSQFQGGYVGVDVFFVISGYVITGLLLRERATTTKTNLVGFYGRRARRILPMSTLVIVVSLIFERYFIGGSIAGLVAVDARWAAVFLANFHFAHVYPNYLAQRAGSPLQTYWSLATEEQFYLVYPFLFVLVAAIGRRWSLRIKLGVVLVAVIGGSLACSVITTVPGFNDLVAYDSPFTRAWELALGGLVAVAAGPLSKLPRVVAGALAWLGLAGIGVATTHYTLLTLYPGDAVVLPVVATALVIAGGVAAPRWGAEALLKLAPFRWLGRWSYSLYLWHYPVLLIADQRWGNPTSTKVHLVLLAVAVALSALTYFAVENPIRNARLLRVPRWGRWISLGMGAVLIGISFLTAALVT